MAEKSPGELKFIPVKDIRENVNSLRGVKKDDEKYQNLLASVKTRGVLEPIQVKRIKDPDNPEGTLYGLINGLQRFSAAQDAGLKEIPAHIMEANQAEIEELQIITNLVKIETKPAEYAKQLNLILERNPNMSILQLAEKLNCGEQWIKERLSLLKLPEQLQTVVDEGKMKLGNAKELAKLVGKVDDESFNAFAQRAMTERPDQFVPAVTEQIKEINKARKEGRAAEQKEFAPHPYQRPFGEVKEEFLNPSVGEQLINDQKPKSKLDVWNLAIAWVVRMDPTSQEERIQEHKDKEAKREADKEARRKEREAKRQAEANKVAGDMEEGAFKKTDADVEEEEQVEEEVTA